jgi:hypothetical protein
MKEGKAEGEVYTAGAPTPFSFRSKGPSDALRPPCEEYRVGGAGGREGGKGSQDE